MVPLNLRQVAIEQQFPMLESFRLPTKAPYKDRDGKWERDWPPNSSVGLLSLSRLYTQHSRRRDWSKLRDRNYLPNSALFLENRCALDLNAALANTRG